MTVPAAPNVFLIALSGVSYAEILGNSNAPSINGYMAKWASSAAFSALAYPSEPNVLALSSGSTQGAVGNTYQQYSVPNLLQDRILAVSKTWKVYAESLGAGNPTVSAGNYSFYFNPAIFYTDNYPANSGLIVDYTQLSTDLSGTPPTFGWIVPNTAHNMSGGPSTIAAGDTFVGSVVSSIRTALPNSLIVLWWDSDDGTGNNQVPLILISPQLVGVGYVSQTPYTHYNLLATIEAALNLNSLGANDTGTMDDFFAQGAAGGVFTAPSFYIPVDGGVWDISEWDASVWASGGGPPGTVYINSPFFYQFDAQANPYPQYSVFSGQLPPGLVLDPDFGVLSGSPQSLGSYTFVIEAANAQGSALTPPITMEVVASPVAVNVNNDLPLANFTDPASPTQALDGGQFYFSVSVTTTAGTGAVSGPSAAAQLVVPPQPVTGLSVVAGNASATLSWTPPTDTGGAPISSYQITVNDETLGFSSSAFYMVVASATVTGLTNGHTYSFVVQVANTDNKILSLGVPTTSVICSGINNIISAVPPNNPSNTPLPSYPLTIASFTPVSDYPNNAPRDIGYAFNINALHPETTAIEQILGVQPFFGLPFQTLQQALNVLAITKANKIHPHAHSSAKNKQGDDHPQYAKLDGTRAFRKPVAAPQATSTKGLVTLSQAQSFGFSVNTLNFGKYPITGQVAASVPTYRAPNEAFAGKYPWIAVGGLFSGVTAPDGLIQVSFQPAWETFNRYRRFVITFEYTVTTIPPNTSGVASFNPLTDEIAVYWVDLSHAMLYVGSTAAGSPQRFVSFCWKALGL